MTNKLDTKWKFTPDHTVKFHMHSTDRVRGMTAQNIIIDEFSDIPLEQAKAAGLLGDLDYLIQLMESADD